MPGVREHWSGDVLHCPYCHGWEVRDQVVGVRATGPMSVHQTLLLRQWSPDIVYFPHPRGDTERRAGRAADGSGDPDRARRGLLRSTHVTGDSPPSG